MVLRARGEVVEREREGHKDRDEHEHGRQRRNDACKELYVSMRMCLSVILYLRTNMLSMLLYIQIYFY